MVVGAPASPFTDVGVRSNRLCMRETSSHVLGPRAYHQTQRNQLLMHATGESLRTYARYISACAVNPVLCVSIVLLLRLCYCRSAALSVRTEFMVSCFHTVGGINERCDNRRKTPVVVSLYGHRAYWSPRLSRRGRALLCLFGLFGTGTGWKPDEFKVSKTRLRRLL